MDAVTTAQRMTADDFLALEPQQRWRQLIDGEIVVNQPSWMHGASQLRICVALDAWVRGGSGRGALNVPVDVQLDEHNVYGPDVLWYRDGRVPRRTDPAPYPVPDIAVEVRSPSTWRYDIGVKKATYQRHGLAELWLVDTAAEVVLVFRRSTPGALEFDVSEELDTGATLSSPLLPGFSMPVAEIFGD